MHDAIRRALPRLALVYSGVTVATSPPTAARVKALLDEAGMHAGSPPANRRGPLYRLSVKAALAHGTGRIHYLDLDRGLHWLARGRKEMAAALRVARRHPLLLLGRTPRAHQSHHLPLYATETLVNRLFTLRLGIDGRLDLLVPSFVLTRDLAALLVKRSRANDAAFYGEWAALLLGMTAQVAYLECRWLDWETPDRHRRAVRRLGLAAWRRRQDTPKEWSLRVDMARDFVAGFERAVERGALRAPAIRRITRRVG